MSTALQRRQQGKQLVTQRPASNPQDWPHKFAPGEPKLYNKLTMVEFLASYAVIQRAKVVNCVSLIAHFTSGQQFAPFTIKCSGEAVLSCFHCRI